MSATRALRAPSKIASALDWKKASGAILALDVGATHIGLALASHPSYGESPLPLEPVELKLQSINGNKRVLSPAVAEQLQRIVQAHNVSSFVVSWPVQKEGRCGAACGKVLHTLDSLVDSESVMTEKKPFCLWDEHHYQAPEDEWGRNPLYGEPCSTQTVHSSKSQEHYSAPDSSSAVAAQVMTDFMKAQWPDLYAHQPSQPAAAPSYANNEEVSIEWLDSYEDTEAYMTVAV